jgi:hypothetical protein
MKARLLTLLLMIGLGLYAVLLPKPHVAVTEAVTGSWYNNNIHVLYVFFPDGTFLSTYLLPPTAWQTVKEWHLKGHWKALGNNRIEIRFPILMGDEHYRERTEELWMLEPGILRDEENRFFERVEHIDPRARL